MWFRAVGIRVGAMLAIVALLLLGLQIGFWIMGDVAQADGPVLDAGSGGVVEGFPPLGGYAPLVPFGTPVPTTANCVSSDIKDVTAVFTGTCVNCTGGMVSTNFDITFNVTSATRYCVT